MTKPSLKYRWRRTWPEHDNDFACSDGKLGFGRISLRTFRPHKGWWQWSLYGLRYDDPGQTSGVMEATVHEAAAFLESSYDRLLPFCSGLHMDVPDEIQHFRFKGLPLPRPAQFRQAYMINGMSLEEANRLYRDPPP